MHTSGLEVSIASSKDLIINSSNPKLIGAALNPEIVRALMQMRTGNPAEPVAVPASLLGLDDAESTVYFIPVAEDNHLLGYVRGGSQLQRFQRAAAELSVPPDRARRGDFRARTGLRLRAGASAMSNPSMQWHMRRRISPRAASSRFPKSGAAMRLACSRGASTRWSRNCGARANASWS